MQPKIPRVALVQSATPGRGLELTPEETQEIGRQPAGFLDQSPTALHPLGSKIFGYSNVTPRRRSVENCQRDPPPKRRFMHPAESSGIQIPPVSCSEQAKHCASFLRCTWRLMALRLSG